jgi:hypothetical protein
MTTPALRLLRPLTLTLLACALSSFAAAQDAPPTPPPDPATDSATPDGADAVTAPPTPTVTFDTVLACQELAAALKDVDAQSADLDAVLAQPAEDTEAFLKAIFIGTQMMMNYGQALFEATGTHEEPCKEKLREANNTADIIQIYRLLLPPTVRGFDFLSRVRASADKLSDPDTSRDMSEALDGYGAAMNKLVELCRQDLQESTLPPDAPKPCEGFRAEIEQRTMPKP